MHEGKCKKCMYWKKLNGLEGTKCCYYLLIEGHSRAVVDGDCKSFKKKGKKHD